MCAIRRQEVLNGDNQPKGSPGWGVASGAVRNLDVIIGFGIGLPAIAAVLIGFMAPVYVANSMIAPQAQTSMGRLGAIASQLGMVSGAAVEESPQFYQRLLTSHNVLVDVARHPVTVDGRNATIATLIDAPADAGPFEMANAIRRRIQVAADWDAGIVRVQTTGASAGIAEYLNSTLLERAQVHNSNLRRQSAGAERTFVEERLLEARSDLERAEVELERFLIANREYRSAPSLAFEASRLQRRIDARQQLVNALTESVEGARIDEVRSTPLFKIVQSPAGTAHRKSRIVLILFTGVLGVMTGIMIAYLREQWSEHETGRTPEWQEFIHSVGTGLRRVKLDGAASGIQRESVTTASE
jgi:uncharacterized protein involved in exopolysaccharide biosynthesis